MPVTINPKGTPLPDGHPFKGTRIIFGGKRPDLSGKNSTPEKKAEQKTSTNPDSVEARMKGVKERLMQRASDGMLEQVSLSTTTDESPSPTGDEEKD